MTRPGPIAIAVLLLAVLLPATADEPAVADARRLEQAFQQAIARAEPAIACVLVYRDSVGATGENTPQQGTSPVERVPDVFGSGVVIDAQGLVLTNTHLIRDAIPVTGQTAARIAVRLPGTRDRDGDVGPSFVSGATVLAADNYSDLAVLKLTQARGGLQALALGGGDRLRKGSWVIALGHPYASGFRDGSPSASWGIVSNLRRRQLGAPSESTQRESLLQLGTLIQTDARLQLGQSGGALIDLDGTLVGLTTAQAALTGYELAGGFALPIDANIRRIIEVLQRGDEVEYGYLGVTSEPESALRFLGGSAVRQVVTNSPAGKAGLLVRDVILEVNGQPIRDHDDLFLHLGCALAGRRATLKVQRGGAPPRVIDVTMAKSPNIKGGYASNKPKSVNGLRVDFMSTVAPSEYIPDGVVVRDYDPRPPADDDPLRKVTLAPGMDIITHVNGQPVNTPSEFYREADRVARAGDKLRLTLASPARTITLPP